jgi:hypothetical protein
MNTIVSSNIFLSTSGALTGIRDVKVIGTVTDDLYDPPLADYLLKDDEVLDLVNEDLSFFGAASRLNVPAELLNFKFLVLKRKGYKIIDPPMIASSDLLKKV